ncbi:MAG TPA: hypothetical protein VF399_10140 [bacterium]
MMNKFYITMIITSFLVISSCHHQPRIVVPPEIDLKDFEPLGIVVFQCNKEGKLNKVVTQKFIEAITEDQKMIQIIELGTQKEVLKKAGVAKIGPEAMKAIGEKYGVKTIIAGDLDISDIHPRVNILPGITLIDISADVEAELVARMYLVDNGATLWTGSGQDERTIGGITFIKGGHFAFDADDPETAYGEMARDLVWRATYDFRVTYR